MRLILGLLITFVAFLATTTHVQAVCPICTVAVGAGLGISRWLGIDDTVTGVWIGGLILSSGLWLADWIEKKGWKIAHKEVFSIGLFFLLIIPPLYWSKMIGLAGNTLLGIDKVVLGTVVGSTIFLFGVWLDKWLRTTNANKVYVYYQKVIIPVFLLSVTSYVLYIITN